MSGEIFRAIYPIIRPPLVALRYVLSKAYDLLFAWWLDKRLVGRSNRRFAADIRKNVPFLFAEYGAEVVPNDREPPPVLDLATVTISTDKLRFSFNRDRGSVQVAIAPAHSPHDWQDLSAILKVIESPEAGSSRLTMIARALRREMPRLELALSEARFQETRNLVGDIYNERLRIIERRERAIDRRLYNR
jgi:hypothetical protein